MVKDKQTNTCRPASNSIELLSSFPEIGEYVDLDFRMVCNIDSSDISPSTWTRLVQEIETIYDQYDGFVIAHGTDTMAYTASALSFAIRDLSKPIILTGSLIPLSEIGSDGRNHLVYACLTATLDIAEVCVVFGSQIMRGNRVKKYRENFVDAFHSPNYPDLGQLGNPTRLHDWRKQRHDQKVQFLPEFNANISLLKIYPGFLPSIIDNVLERGAEGIVIEGFGPGNVPFVNEDRSIIPYIKKATDRGIMIMMANQMEHGITNLERYEGGFKALQAGAISSGDMTTEAAVTKLMWCIANGSSFEERRDLFTSDLSGELTTSGNYTRLAA